MPTYEYKCPACGHKFEKFQSITAAPIKKCEHCGKNKAVRLIGTGAGLIFKGSGFYITDYRSEGYKEKAKADVAPTESKKSDSAATTDSKPSEKKESTAAQAKAESKPAAKPETKAEPKPEKKPEAKSSSAKKRG